LRKKIDELEIKLTIRDKNLATENKDNLGNFNGEVEVVVDCDDDDCDDDDRIDENLFENIDPARGVCMYEKKHFDVLILSDSIYRHVGVSVPKTNSNEGPIYKKFELCNGNIRCLKVVIPGALAPRLIAEAAIIHRKYTFGEIILHCGANYIPNPRSFRPYFWCEAVDDVTQLLNELRKLFLTNVTFSPILPQLSSPPGAIYAINARINNFCQRNDFSRLFPEEFENFNSIELKKLIARDQIHLSFVGVEKLTLAVENHIKFLFNASGLDDE
jgi:hypothetical protein